MNAAVDRILEPLRSGGRTAYLGEPVTVTDHLLQSAHVAELDGAHPSLVVAALLHDIGWLLRAGPRRHETRGANFVAGYLGPEVVEPIRLHVAAKRYLCTVDPCYFDTLSAASQRTMVVQGGLLDDAAVAAFTGEPFADGALRLRRYDDEAKVPGCATPDLSHFAGLLETQLII
jgi:predicted HD phosphohydrolase